MNFDLPPQVDAFRREVREFMAEHVTPDVLAECRATGTMHNWPLHRALAEKGWTLAQEAARKLGPASAAGDPDVALSRGARRCHARALIQAALAANQQGKPTEERSDSWVLPEDLDVRYPAPIQNQVDRSLAYDLVSDVDATAFRVAGMRSHGRPQFRCGLLSAVPEWEPRP